MARLKAIELVGTGMLDLGFGVASDELWNVERTLIEVSPEGGDSVEGGVAREACMLRLVGIARNVLLMKAIACLSPNLPGQLVGYCVDVVEGGRAVL